MLYVTERAVFELTDEGMMLVEIAAGLDLERDILAKLGFTPRIAPALKKMPACIFDEAPMQYFSDRA